MSPLLPDEIRVLRTLTRSWPDSAMVVLGAAALRYFMPMAWRTTEDLDLTVAAGLGDVTAVLCHLPGWSRDPRNEQRWHAPPGIAVDIVPAGDEALARGYVEWPETGARMSLLGMRLAFEHAVDLRVADDLVVSLAPVHVIAVLKMIAFMDRPEERQKDLGDLAHIMSAYVGEDSERRFSPEVPGDLTEYDDVAPFLLGSDIAAIVNAEERERLSEFVALAEDEARGPGLLARMSALGPPSWRDPNTALERVRAFRRGMLGH